MNDFVEQQLNQVFNVNSVYHFVDFEDTILSPLETVIVHVLHEMYDSNIKGEHCDRVSTIASVGNSEMDGFIVLAVSNVYEACKCKVEVTYHTGIQSIFIGREECDDILAVGIIDETNLKEDRIFLYECDIHWCTLMVKHQPLAKYIAKEIETILNSLFHRWDILFQTQSSREQANVFWIPVLDPVLTTDNSPMSNHSVYGTNYFSFSEDFSLFYALDTLYTQFLFLFQSMESSVPYVEHRFQRDFGLRNGVSRFYNNEDFRIPVSAMYTPFQNYGIGHIITIGSGIFTFQIRIRMTVVRKPALITSSNRRNRDSYMYRTWNADDSITLRYREKRLITSVVFLNKNAIETGDESYCSTKEYGFANNIARFKVKSNRITYSLKRCIQMQYADAVYLYIEEQLLGKKGCNIALLQTICDYLIKDEQSQDCDRKVKKAKLYANPFKVEEEALFSHEKIYQNFI